MYINTWKHIFALRRLSGLGRYLLRSTLYPISLPSVVGRWISDLMSNTRWVGLVIDKLIELGELDKLGRLMNTPTAVFQFERKENLIKQWIFVLISIIDNNKLKLQIHDVKRILFISLFTSAIITRNLDTCTQIHKNIYSSWVSWVG